MQVVLVELMPLVLTGRETNHAMAKKVAGAECSDDDEASRRCGAEGEHCWLASLLVVVSRLFANHHIHRFCDGNLNKISRQDANLKSRGVVVGCGQVLQKCTMWCAVSLCRMQSRRD